MPRIEFEQTEVVSAAGRAWHKGEPAIIQDNGFPVASIVFLTESANQFAGYGAILDFQITDSHGNNYAAQIGKDMVTAAAQVQFPDDFAPQKDEQDVHNIIPDKIVRRKMPEQNQFIKALMAALEPIFQDAEQVVQAASLPAPELTPASKPESFSKRLRREVRELIGGQLPNHGVFRTGFDGGTTIVWKKEPGSSFVYFAASTCSPNQKDTYKEETGARIAYKRLIDGQSVSLPIYRGDSAESMLISMFGRYENAAQNSLWKRFEADATALRKRYADKGLDILVSV